MPINHTPKTALRGPGRRAGDVLGGTMGLVRYLPPLHDAALFLAQIGGRL